MYVWRYIGLLQSAERELLLDIVLYCQVFEKEKQCSQFGVDRLTAVCRKSGGSCCRGKPPAEDSEQLDNHALPLVGCLICYLSGVLLSSFLTWNISVLLDCHLVWLSCSRPLDNHALVVCLIFYCLVFYCLPFQLHIVVILLTQHFCTA